MPPIEKADVAIIGAGAAGLMCALRAAERGKSVIVLEKSEKIAKKILISGGGRCNFTNWDTRPENFISNNPHFCRSALARYTPQHFIALVERHHIAYHEKKLGQLFCDSSARDIVALFEKELAHYGVRLFTHQDVRSVDSTAELFQVQCEHSVYASRSLVLATGGLSIPKMGASDFGLRLARQFGHRIIQPRPALVPLTFSAELRVALSELSGISLDAIVRCGDAEFRENILFTHKGISGPAILQISSYWKPGQQLHLNILPDLDVLSLLQSEHQSKIELKNLLSQFLPKRFCECWCSLYAHSRPMNHYLHRELELISEQLKNWTLIPSGTEGFDKAEVTVGGVDTRELSSKTMESLRVPNLYFIGEVVDVTGWLGGYNFQWAWSSGAAAGDVVG